MPFLLYAATAIAVLAIVHRFVRPLSRAAAIVLFALPLGLTGYALFTGGVYGPIDHLYQEQPHAALAAQYGIDSIRNVSATDIFSEFFPWRRAVQLSLARGEWPLWNPYNLCGHPLAEEVQSAPFSPFTLIACLLPAATSLTYSAAIAFFLAGVSAFLFARELECSESASLFAAAGWAFASSIVLYVQTAMGFTTLYAPLLFAATNRVVRRPGLGSGSLLMTALSLAILAGHPESLFISVLAACAYGLFELVRKSQTALWRAIATALVAGVMAALLCAITLLPLIEAIPQSVEYAIKNNTLGVRSQGVPTERFLAEIATYFFPHLDVRSWISPHLGYISAETAAAGSIVLALAIYAIWRKRSAETWFFAALSILCMVIGARWQPLADALRHVPLLDITLLDRFAFMAALGLVMLAALGVDELARRRDFIPAAITLAVVCALLGAGMLWLRSHIADTPADFGHARMFAEIVFLALASLLLFARAPMRFVMPALFGLLVAQRVVSEIDTFRTFPAEAAYPRVPILDHVKNIGAPFRLVGRGTVFPPATNTFYGLEDPRGYEALTLHHFGNTFRLWSHRHHVWFNRVDDLTAPFLSFLNVRFALQPDALPVPGGWRSIASDGGTRLIENESVLDRIFVPQRVRLTGASADEIVDRMTTVRDFRSVAFITTHEEQGERENGPGRVTLRARSAGRYAFAADMQRDGWVVVSDTAWKGWRAYVDGRRVKLQRANAAFLSVFVPAGRHEVRLVYLPKSFVRGRTISGVTLLVIVILLVIPKRSEG